MTAFIFGTLISTLPISLPFILIAWTVTVLYRHHQHKRVNWWWMIALAAFIITLVNILSNTLVSFTPDRDGFQFHGNINLVPFISIFKMVNDLLSSQPSGYSFINFFGNIGFFVPFGFFIPFLSKKFASAWKVILFGCLLSIFIEVWQLFLPARGSDIDDVILNTLGTAIGYLLFWIARKVFPRFIAHFLI